MRHALTLLAEEFATLLRNLDRIEPHALLHLANVGTLQRLGHILVAVVCRRFDPLKHGQVSRRVYFLHVLELERDRRVHSGKSVERQLPSYMLTLGLRH